MHPNNKKKNIKFKVDIDNLALEQMEVQEEDGGMPRWRTPEEIGGTPEAVDGRGWKEKLSCSREIGIRGNGERAVVRKLDQKPYTASF
ncbi:hypothetical protein E3N88_24340 [Mikania micrantha]|uniref:Uncharacterized protein n=1 Tax=Mikania micrantha TaxID=192012 RepID=A0A5N6N2N4_9ASTR|nr:hypothetical protein E3N88_24340 [Mikania micrantha]